MVLNNNADIVIKLRVELDKAKQNLRKAGQEFQKAGKNSQKALEGYDEALANVDKSTERLRKTMSGVRQEFPAWALSTMFFGMQMVSVFRSVWSSATKTFNDIMHSVEGTVTAFDHLEGATTYLRFVAGQALEPVAMALLPIIDSLSDWIHGNQELFRTLMLIFGAGGVLLTGTGLAALNFNAIVGAVTAIKGGIITFGATLTKVLGTISLIKGAFIAIGIAAIIAMWKTNFAGFKDFITETFEGIVETIKSIFGNLVTIFKEVFDLIINIFEGDWEAAMDNLVQILLNAVAIITKIVWGLGMVLINTFIFAINFIKSAFMGLIDLQLHGLQQLARGIDNIFGTSFSGRVQGLRNTLSSLSDMTDINYVSVDYIKRGLDNVDNILGLNDNSRNEPMSYYDNKDVTINIYQQPGEDAMSLARTVDDELMSRFTQ